MGEEWTPDYEYLNLYEMENGKVKLLYKNVTKQYKLISIGVVGNDLYCIYDGYLSLYKNNKFEKLVKIGYLSGGIKIVGRSSKDIAIKHEKGLYHYDGKNIKELLNFNDKPNNFCQVIHMEENKIMMFLNELGKWRTIIYTGIIK